MRLVEIPRFRAVSSGEHTLDEIFGRESSFQAWLKAHGHLLKKHLFEPCDFLWHEDRDIDRSVWILATARSRPFTAARPTLAANPRTI